MSDKNQYARRDVVKWGAGGLAATTLGGLGCATVGIRPEARSGVDYFKRFGIDETVLKEVLAVALSSGGDFADVYIQHGLTNSLSLEDGQVNGASNNVQLGAGVRVVVGGQTGYGYTEELSLASLKTAAKTAASIAQGSARAAPVAFRVPNSMPSRYAIARKWENVQTPEKLPFLTGLNTATFAKDSRIKKVSVMFNDSTDVVLIATSDGLIVEDYQPMARLYLSCVAEQKGRRESNGYNIAGRVGLDFYTKERLDRIVTEAVARTTILFDAVSPAAGEMPVVLGSGSSGILLHEAIGHGMEADFNRTNQSIYSDKLGKPIAKPFVNIVDDGTIDFARGAINVDDEGVPAQKTMLVENGVLATYMHDRISAKHYGVKPTGSGRRESYKHMPLPRMRATYMLPGPHTREEIIASVKKGIYCDNFTNGQVQIGAGDFSFYVKNGFLIEDGKLTRPLKDVNIIGNGPKVLEQVDMVANDLKIDEGGWTCGKSGQSVPVSQGMPSVRIASITVGSRGAKS